MTACAKRFDEIGPGAIYRGWRPDSLTREMAIGLGAQEFARSEQRFHELRTVFLDSIGARKHGDTQARFRQASEFQDLDDRTLRICQQLAGIAHAPLGEPTGGTTVAAERPLESDEIEPTRDSSEGAIPMSAAAADTPSATTREEDTAENRQEERIGARPASEAADLPDCIVRRVPLIYAPVNDDVDVVQRAVTRFGRSYMAFVIRQLQALHGDAWMRRGCSKPLRDKCDERSEHGKAVNPTERIGYAEYGELCDVIVNGTNWRAFEIYFRDQFRTKEELQLRFADIRDLRVSAMHPELREVHLLENAAKLQAMRMIAEAFDPDTAQAVADLFRGQTSPAVEQEPELRPQGERLLSNLTSLEEPRLIGRETEMRRLQEFWNDQWSRTLCITGPGGVGKTALLESSLYGLLNRPLRPGEPPNPQVVVYLTAKTKYLPRMRQAPDALRFDTLRRVYEVTLQLLGDAPIETMLTNELRDRVYRVGSGAGGSPDNSIEILFALDNLESLEDAQLTAINVFLTNLPSRCKAIVTTRVHQEVGEPLHLPGLAPDDARELFLRNLAEVGIEPSKGDFVTIEEIIEYTGAVPLSLIHCAQLVKDGHDIKELPGLIKGKTFLGLMKFSYESSLARLSDEEFGVLYLMALSDNPSPRRRLAAITHDEDTLTAAIDLLDQRHLIRRSNNEERNKVLFRIFDNTLRDYVKSQARHRLTMERKRDIEQQAGVVPSRAQSESIGIEIDRVIMQAEHTAQTDRRKAIDLLEQAVGQFGEDPKLLTSLGYWHYREYNRSMARKLLERAIEAGSDLPDTFAILAEVQFYERQYGDGLAHARQALNYSRSHPKANQIAAQCLLELVDRSRLQYDVRRRLELVKEARTHAQRSIIADDWSPGANASNRRAEDLIRRAEELLDGGQRAG